ncbi:DUF6221 family protein [Nocardia abscessus]|uniref:DUF6221 family protein n=1 Tax=Nocardia abscessus TaxID=120957 RepID=UPI0002F40F00|nr:DUF6221 family protein [Nocardia abscessus]MCC3333569.1 DUF6221 family protein [Nocardia abscessus]
MTSDTPLSRLRAGLDRDEQLARAAAERAAEWRSDGKGVAGGPFTPADPEWGMEESGTHTIVYDEGWPLASEAHHIARQCPQATLDRVEAIREVIADYQRRLPSDDDPALEDPEFRASWMGYRIAGELFLRALASIYPEPTDETETP